MTVVEDIVKKKIDTEQLEKSNSTDIRKFGTVHKRPLPFSKRAVLPLRERKMRQLCISDALSRILS
jgi:hypothetical protein